MQELEPKNWGLPGGYPSKRGAKRVRVPVLVSGVVQELVEAKWKLRAKKLIRNSLPCCGRRIGVEQDGVQSLKEVPSFACW